MGALLAALARGGGDSPSALVGRAPTAVAVFDRALICRWVNPAFEEMTGTAASGLLGRAGAEVLAAWTGAPELLAATLAEGTAGQVAGTVADSPGGDGWWWICACAPLEDPGREPFGVAVYALAARAAPRAELVSAQARLAVLAEASERIGSSLDVETSSAELARFAVPRFAELVTVELLTDPQAPGGPAAGPVRVERTAVADATGAAAAADPPLRYGRAVRYSPQDAAARSLRERRVVLSPALLSDEDLAQWSSDPALRAGYTAAGIGTALVVPLHSRGRTLGVLTAGRARTRPGGAAFSEAEVQVLRDVADRAAVSLDNAQRFARSQGITLDLQRALLAEPGSPHPNLQLATRYRPSGTATMVGGDWFETIRLSYGRTLLVIGDVMGHGVEAAVDMSAYRSMLRYVAATDLPPHRILLQVDALTAENEATRPATCLLALADPGRGRCTFASAGHLPPALFGAAQGATALLDVPTGPPLGTGLGAYESAVHPLTPGQVLLMCTDGLVERRGEDIDASLARLTALHPDPAAPLDALLDLVLRQVAPETAEDDIAVLAARVKG